MSACYWRSHFSMWNAVHLPVNDCEDDLRWYNTSLTVTRSISVGTTIFLSEQLDIAVFQMIACYESTFLISHIFWLYLFLEIKIVASITAIDALVGYYHSRVLSQYRSTILSDFIMFSAWLWLSSNLFLYSHRCLFCRFLSNEVDHKNTWSKHRIRIRILEDPMR